MTSSLAQAVIRELQAIDADLLDVKDYIDEITCKDSMGPTFEKFSKRLSAVLEQVEQVVEQNELIEQAARKWAALTDKQISVYIKNGDEFVVYRRRVDIMDRTVGLDFLGKAGDFEGVVKILMG